MVSYSRSLLVEGVVVEFMLFLLQWLLMLLTFWLSYGEL
jgi:hypothetical protein